jgi:hypothetical protein
VWLSVRAHAETKTERSRLTLALPRVAAEALRALQDVQTQERKLAADKWQDSGLVFTTHRGAPLRLIAQQVNLQRLQMGLPPRATMPALVTWSKTLSRGSSSKLVSSEGRLRSRRTLTPRSDYARPAR